MNTFYLKLVLMPAVIGIVTLASRRWGNTIGGMIASLPWVVGPILLFFAIEQSTTFAIKTIPGIMAGVIGWLAFCMAYAYFSVKYAWYITIWISYLALLITVLLFDFVHLPLIPIYFLTNILTFICLKFYPKTEGESKNKVLKFDIPIRMVVITIFVILITSLAQKLGSSWSGILAPFPVITSILAVFTHYTQGSSACVRILRGMLAGMFGFAAYLLIQGLLVEHFSLAITFLIGLAVNFFINWQVAKVID